MIIAITGKMSSGKDLVGSIIRTILFEQTHTIWQTKKYAAKLKQIASILLDIDVEEFEDQSFKKKYLVDWGMTVREFLQKLGTDAVRVGIHTDAWLISLFTDYSDLDNWIITDCRFLNEAKAVKDRGGIVIKVIRPSLDSTGTHPSETELEQIEADYTLVNDSTIEELTKKISSILKEEKLIISDDKKE